MTKIVLNCKLIVKQAVNKQYCDKVPLIVICIDSITTNSAHTVNNVILLYRGLSTACQLNF